MCQPRDSKQCERRSLDDNDNEDDDVANIKDNHDEDNHKEDLNDLLFILD